MNPVVSVVVPVYNVESYLAQCLDSVLSQTLQDIEVICVNDGSTDGSAALLARYADQDERVRVVQQPNGGYGKAVNNGFGLARGEWLAIVEPDDFISPHMYEDLVANARLLDGKVADIVKSSFWMYYDASASAPERRETPFLGKVMPGHRCEVTAEACPDLVRQHPSIWSAIYRRDFLAEHGIRMMEVPGAGWTDNPFMLDTMLRARAVVWVPAAYYHYRQTNPGSSSNLRDFHLPFDRLRDMRRIYAELNVHSPGLLSALYSRTLTYITKQILAEGGFPEKDPELQALIAEALEPLDRTVLLSRESLISQKCKDYYRDFMGMKLAAVKPRARREKPEFTIVLPIKDDRDGLWPTLESIMAQSYTNFEVVCVDCETNDRGAQISAQVAGRDERFRMVDRSCRSVGQGLTAALSQAQGDYVTVLRAGVCFGASGFLQKVHDAVRAQNGVMADIVACENDLTFCADSRIQASPSWRLVERDEGCGRLASMASVGVAGKLVSRSLLRQLAEKHADEADIFGEASAVFGVFSLAKSVLFVAGCPAEGAAVHDGANSMVSDRAVGAHQALQIAGCELASDSADSGNQAAMTAPCTEADNLAYILHVLAYDLGRLFSNDDSEAQFARLRARFGQVAPLAEPHLALIPNAGDYFALQDALGKSYPQYLSTRLHESNDSSARLKQRVARLQASTGYRAEQTVKQGVKTVLPSSIIAKVKGR